MSVGVCCPTRRPAEFQETCRSFAETKTAKDTMLLAYVDDVGEDLYAKIDTFGIARIHVGPQIGPARGVNALVQAFPEYDVYGLATDECVFGTFGWDQYAEKTVASFPGRLGVLSPAHSTSRFVNYPFVSRQWIDLLGYFAHPRFFHRCWDSVLQLIGEHTRIVYAEPEEFYIGNHPMPAFNAGRLPEDAMQFLYWAVNDFATEERLIRSAMEAA